MYVTSNACIDSKSIGPLIKVKPTIEDFFGSKVAFQGLFTISNVIQENKNSEVKV